MLVARFLWGFSRTAAAQQAAEPLAEFLRISALDNQFHNFLWAAGESGSFPIAKSRCIPRTAKNRICVFSQMNQRMPLSRRRRCRVVPVVQKLGDHSSLAVPLQKAPVGIRSSAG
jgi:hypothetical protein